MTFTEAAVEILKLVGRPLHYKKITELAIERNLLSHVGKSPELTMSSRLATMVKKDRGEEPIVKVKPGVFALRDFTSEMMALAESDENIDLSSLAPPSPRQPEPTGISVENGHGTIASSGARDQPHADGEAPVAAVVTPKRAMPGAEVFPEEADDNEPILAGLDDEDEEDDRAGGGRRGRRRRRGRGKGEGDKPGGEGEETQARAERAPEPAQRDRDRDHRDRDRDRGRDRGRDRDRDRDRPRDDRDRPRDADRDRDRGRPPPVDFSREPQQDDLLGRDLADAVHAILDGGERAAVTYHQIADHLVRRGRLVGDPGALAPSVAAAIRADAKRRERSRFRHVDGRVALVDWYLPRDAVRQERDVVRFAERQRDQVRRAFLRKLQELPSAGFVELVATWLNAEGVSGLRAVRRPGSSAQEIHLAGVLRRGAEETRIAIVVLRDGRELSREKIVEVRGSLHHYGNASAAWFVCLGPVSRGAREEAVVPGTTPVSPYDGLQLAEAMESRRIGLVPVSIPTSAIDLDLLDALRGSPEAILRDRDDRPRDERRDDRPREREDRPRDDRPREDRPREDRPRDDRPREDRPREDRPREDRPRDDRPRDDRGRDRGRERDATAEVTERAEGASPEASRDASTAAEGATVDAAREGEPGDRGPGRRRRRRRGRGRGASEEGAAVTATDAAGDSEDAQGEAADEELDVDIEEGSVEEGRPDVERASLEPGRDLDMPSVADEIADSDSDNGSTADGDEDDDADDQHAALLAMTEDDDRDDEDRASDDDEDGLDGDADDDRREEDEG
jgi:hypothetical protein